jgi:hypothetical protein
MPVTRHSVYGGSNASMWLNCPGGVALRTQVPRHPAGLAAIHGSAQHEVMEQLLLDPDKMPEDFLASTVLGVKLEGHHIMAIKLALEEYQKIEETFPVLASLYSEREVGMTDEAYGSLDAALVGGKRAAIIDFKFGGQEVTADSDQGMVYACYARKSIPEFAKVEEIDLYIIQPAMDPPTDKRTVSAAVLDAFETTIGTAIRVSKQPGAPFVEGEWCQYCAAKLVCPSKTQRLDTLVAPNHTMNLDEIADRLLKIRGWKKWAEEAEERLQHEIENGVKVKGWKLVGKRAIRQWRDEAAAIAFFKSRKVPAAQYLVTKLLSPAQAEKVIPKTEVNKLANPVSSGNTIAPVADPRPEVVSPQMFANVLKKIA